jgi:hypothetical protein
VNLANWSDDDAPIDLEPQAPKAKDVVHPGDPFRMARSHRLLSRNMNRMIKPAALNRRITAPSTISVLAHEFH